MENKDMSKIIKKRIVCNKVFPKNAFFKCRLYGVIYDLWLTK